MVNVIYSCYDNSYDYYSGQSSGKSEINSGACTGSGIIEQ